MSWAGCLAPVWAITPLKRIPLGNPHHSCIALCWFSTQSLPHKETHVGLHVIACYCIPILTKTWVCQKNVVKFPNIKFHQNAFSGFLSCYTWTDRYTNMVKLMGTILQLLIWNTLKNSGSWRNNFTVWWCFFFHWIWCLITTETYIILLICTWIWVYYGFLALMHTILNYLMQLIIVL
jgi:hypothetical protein